MVNDMSLNTIKSRLNQQLEELEKRAESAARHLSTRHSSDSAEQAQERENDDVLAAIKQESIDEIREIKRAIQRIENGEYGICAACQNEILPARLEVLPYATLCIQCAEKDEYR
jgi:DnaK suppressor protein